MGTPRNASGSKRQIKYSAVSFDGVTPADATVKAHAPAPRKKPVKKPQTKTVEEEVKDIATTTTAPVSEFENDAEQAAFDFLRVPECSRKSKTRFEWITEFNNLAGEFTKLLKMYQELKTKFDLMTKPRVLSSRTNGSSWN